MKNTLTIALVGILSIGGGYLGHQASEYLSADKISNDVAITETEQNNFIKLVDFKMSEDSEGQCKYMDLTMASEKAVDAVAHIQTHFVREEITYDPILKLFYGKDAYKIRERHGKSSGSGVVMSADGYIVTNNHVVQDAKEITVMLKQKKYTATLVGTDPSTDLAVIKIDAKGLDYSAFGNSDNLKLGEWVLAVGNPLNLQSTVTAGIVSAKNRNIDLLTSNYNPKDNIFPVESFIQTDAAVNSGNSGGALVNVKGELVGINTAIASGTGFYAGYSFAIPSNIVKKVAFDLMTYGEVKRVQLGINLIQNNSDLMDEYQLGSEKGLVITNVIQGGNAEKSGLKPMDIILGVGNKSVQSVSELQASIVLNNPGDKVKLSILRGGTKKIVEVMMAS